MRWIATVVLSTLPLALVGSQAQAWNSPGHEQVADIAWSKLNADAKLEIGKILAKGDPEFRPTSASEAAVRSAFRKAATFPDHIKNHQDTIYEPLVTSLNKKFQPQNDPLISPSQRSRCKSWHFLDKPIRFSGPEPKIPKSNAVAAMALARQELATLQGASNPDRRMQFWWLAWIEHVVGDLHQPLHCTASFEFGDGDGGGNTYKLGIPSPFDPTEDMSLHSFWDSGIDHVKQAEKDQGKPIRVDLVTARWNGEGLLSLTSPEAKNLDVKSWVNAGAKLADQKVYEGLVPGGVPDGSYRLRERTVCKQGALLAGYRLANILNGILGQ